MSCALNRLRNGAASWIAGATSLRVRWPSRNTARAPARDSSIRAPHWSWHTPRFPRQLAATHWSTPVGQELDLVPHLHSGGGRAKTQDSAQLLADREPLPGGQNHSAMFSPSADPHLVKAIEIRDVERVEDAPMLGGKCQLFVARLL